MCFWNIYGHVKKVVNNKCYVKYIVLVISVFITGWGFNKGKINYGNACCVWVQNISCLGKTLEHLQMYLLFYIGGNMVSHWLTLSLSSRKPETGDWWLHNYIKRGSLFYYHLITYGLFNYGFSNSLSSVKW
jgi:hypothetical protein